MGVSFLYVTGCECVDVDDTSNGGVEGYRPELYCKVKEIVLMIMKKLRQIRENQKKNGKKGFSMIELIIVIAIMAILIALIGTQLIPYLEKSRQSKDMTTLDTCLMNFQAAAATSETIMNPGDNWSGIDALPFAAEYKNLAGAAYDTDTELKAALKSKAASSGTQLKFGVDASGVLYVEFGGLKVSSTQSGAISATP